MKQTKSLQKLQPQNLFGLGLTHYFRCQRQKKRCNSEFWPAKEERMKLLAQNPEIKSDR